MKATRIDAARPGASAGRPAPRRMVVALFGPACILLGAVFFVWLIWRGLKIGSGPHSDFAVFYHAAVAARTGDDMYAVHGGGYVYPPLLAVLLVPLGLLELVPAAHLWTVLLAAGLLLAVHVWTRVLDGRVGGSLTTIDRWAVGSVAVVLLGQTWRSEFQYGNSNLLLIIATGLALTNLGRRPHIVGLALAFAAMIKYFPIALLPYLLIRRRWRESAWFVGGLLAFSFLPALYLGWDRNLGYLARAFRGVFEMVGLVPKAGGAGIIPVDAGYSIAVTSTMARWEKWLGWPPGAGLAAAAAIALTCLALAVWMYRRADAPLFVGRSPTIDDTDPRARSIVGMEWVVILAAAIIFAPQGTHRHLNMLLPLLVLSGVLAWSSPSWRTKLTLTTAAAIFTAGAAAIPGLPNLRRATEIWNQAGGSATCVLTLIFTVTWLTLTRRTNPPHSD